ncbi:VWA domain-containing protein [Lederbergia lenta]|uniref:D-amino acid dehydrogenase, large subunit n=1 Tax=Lederbergia lenta TaxID=1467 RepID=A0A2X4WTX9_LEDLE|nr:VWA domain-containing protein [Lederbergia lenta]MEC2322883.1 VWA domain-containing protein [Lederbergia lenta]SQI61952.1 D-amino acid dehydrogenase, large subunit [Lederbergia lenta]
MRKLLYGFVILIFILTACSSKEKPAEKSKSTEKQTESIATEKPIESGYKPKEVEYYDIENVDREFTDVEKELLRHPGIYSGDQYDEGKVNEALEQLPDDLTQEQYLEEMLYLLAEDFHEEMQTLVNFDSSVEVNVDRPDETVNSPTLKTAHYAILIDASGSMKAMSGNKTRMEAAKAAVKEFAEQVPENATISMRVYGHEGTGSDTDKKLSCSSSENLYNDHFNQKEFQQSLDKVKPAGWTPIALALESVKEDIPENTDDVVVYVVSDGIETCDGDPVKAAKELVDADIQTVVNIIGFDVDDAGQTLLKEVASAGNGEFTYVNSERDFKNYMKVQYEEIQKKWMEWKETGKSEAYEIKEQKKELAYSTKESMKAKSIQEKERLKMAQIYLKDRFADYDHPASKMFSMIVDYGDAKWRYAVDTGNQAWRESVDNGNAEWNDYVDEGNKKINETIDKKNE